MLIFIICTVICFKIDSTISHIGFLLLSLAIITQQSIDSFIFYIFQYIITSLNIFLILLGISYIIDIRYTTENNNKKIFLIKLITDIKYISELKSLYTKNPFFGINLSICLFSMAGVPPLIGFFSKFLVLYSAVQSGYIFLSFVCIIVSVISASYYLKIINVLFLPKTELEYNSNESLKDFIELSDNISEQNIKNLKTAENIKLEKISLKVLSNKHAYIISLLSLFILLFFAKPYLWLNNSLVVSLCLFFD